MDTSIDLLEVLTDKELNNNQNNTSSNSTSDKEYKQITSENLQSQQNSPISSKEELDLLQKLSLADITNSWEEIIEVLEKQNSKTAHLLSEAKLSEFDGTHLLITLINSHKFHQNSHKYA